ncbi:hypothetical protein LY90DRAFT_701520 [Neocallimastix californiae]|uniref:ELMO domain-containing protein n=1 Tax=Neocallimastix californiae TaxID=1754190 RepID=A0A1Y2DII7_9FUNG|nr:hypothetical protein LY90DRAFT_701520 [Neocallimastix californiae]|eukprot:ORY58625.1 hypothetical protein LY90DRAFT_701520 [Neocallimastix californiae]
MPKIFHIKKNKSKIHDYVIDTTLPVQTIVKNICAELNNNDLQDLSLRNFETEELITDENIKTIIKEGDHICLVPSSVVEAAETVKNMESSDEAVVKRTIFMLQKYIKELEFAEEFIKLGGINNLQKTIMTCEGNTLAYALKSFENLMELDHGWENFSEEFVHMVGTIIVREQFVNICRPATNIIIKLVCADKSSKGVQCYGYEIVNKAITSNELLPVLVQRITETEYILQVNSLHLINSLFEHVTDEYKNEFINNLFELNINESVYTLITRNPEVELTKQLNEFQRLTLNEINNKKNTPFSAENEKHSKMLDELWTLSELTEDGDNKWKKIGFSSETPNNDIFKVGIYGLEVINRYAKTNTESYKNILKKELECTDGKPCPIMQSSIEIIDILLDYCGVTKKPSSFQPVIFLIENIFGTLLECFVKIWHESEIKNSPEDILQVSLLIKSQFRYSIEKVGKGKSDDLDQFKTDMLETLYQTIKERQSNE